MFAYLTKFLYQPKVENSPGIKSADVQKCINLSISIVSSKSILESVVSDFKKISVPL